MEVIYQALDEATGPGDDWPQSGYDFPNPAFLYVAVRLLKRNQHHARRAAVMLTTNQEDP